MKTVYKNRYGDDILFEQVEPNKIEVSGYSNYFRVAYENDYTEAYNTYLEENHSSMSFEEFKEEIHEEHSNLKKYRTLVKSDTNNYHMFDPSGGPYLSKGDNIGTYFNNKIGTQIIEKIEFGINKVVFTTKSKN